MDGGHIQGLLKEKRNEVNCYLGGLGEAVHTFGPTLSWDEQGEVDNPEEVQRVWVEQLHSVLLQHTSTLQPQSAQRLKLEEEGHEGCYNLQTQAGRDGIPYSSTLLSCTLHPLRRVHCNAAPRGHHSRCSAYSWQTQQAAALGCHLDLPRHPHVQGPVLQPVHHNTTSASSLPQTPQPVCQRRLPCCLLQTTPKLTRNRALKQT